MSISMEYGFRKMNLLLNRYRAYFRHLLHTVPGRNILLEFEHSMDFKFACCLGKFDLRIPLNFPYKALF